ncbi:MAG: hypothetical protein JWQ71_2688 [Pedosphaera sp.]|nr:hypothetical protein [Pedosphaera sp.]
MKQGKRWLTVVVFAIAMAWLESAVVFYLRTLSNRIEPYQAEPLPPVAGLAAVELVREAATLIMLFTIGMLAGKSWRSRWGYAAIAFGVWDIFYYVFLKVITHWPNSLLDWDILFLLPLPWWGPVIAPVLIALLMIVWGTLASQWEHQFERSFRTEWKAWLLNFIGMALALYVFMEDAIRVAKRGEDALRMMLPSHFNWPLFIIALVLMAAPIVYCGRQIRQRRPPMQMEPSPTT